MKQKLLIVGAGGFGREVAVWAAEAGYDVRGFLDDNLQALLGYKMGLSVLGLPREYRVEPSTKLVIAVGDPTIKAALAQDLTKRGWFFAQLIHPAAKVGPRCLLGDGVILCPQTVLTCDVTLGDHVGVNLACTLGHDVTVGEASQLNSQVDLTGGVTLGERVLCGSRASVLPGLTVGDDACIGAGSVVVKDVPAGQTVFGLPARRLG